MPGRNPHGAYVAFKRPLQTAYSMIADGQVTTSVSPGKRNVYETITLYLGPKDAWVDLRGNGERSSRLKFKGKIYYQIIQVKRRGNGKYRVTTVGYDYSVKTRDDRDVFDYHWHPEGKSDWTEPHFHVGTPQLSDDSVINNKQHWSTGRITFEDVVRQLIKELDVPDPFDGWEEELEKSEAPHLQFRSWGGGKRRR